MDLSALVSVTPSGDRLLVGRGKAVETYAIARENARVCAHRIGTASLPGAPRQLLVAPDGAAYALTARDSYGVELVRIEGDRVLPLRRLDVQPNAAVATRGQLVLAIPGADLVPPQLVGLRRRDGKLLWQEALTSSNVRLRAGRADEVLVIEPRARRMRWVDAARRVEGCRPSGDGGPSSHPAGHDDEPKNQPGKPCSSCPPTCKPKDDKHPGERPPHPRDPNDNCIPGSDGDPDGCIVTYIQNGFVVSINLCVPGEPPCTARLDWPAASVSRTPRTVVAASRDGRRVAVLDGATLARLHEHRTRRGRITTLAARHADHVLLLGADGVLTFLDPTPLLPPLQPEFTSDAKPAVFEGQSAALSYSNAGEQIGFRNVLIVPVMEPGQVFNGTVSDFSGDPLIEKITEQAMAFYVESTYDNLTLQFQWFGADTPTLYTGVPLQLSKPLRSYWGPAWDPGAISSTVPVPGGGLALSFSGDEVLSVRAIPSPAETYNEELFEIRFPAASYRTRIPNALAILSFGPGTAPARSISIQGSDRAGNPFSASVDTSVLSGTTQVDLARSALSANNDQLEALADVIEEMLSSSAALAGLFERPSVVWQDDGDETGMLHISLAFTSGGGSAPKVTSFDIDDLLNELGGGSRTASFSIPGDEGALATYIQRNVADASVRNPEFGSDLRNCYFDLTDFPPTAEIDAGQLTIRINLSTRHGRYPARIELESQSGLEKIGMDNPTSIEGEDTGFSGGGGPQLKEYEALFNDVYTAMIDATIVSWNGNDEGAIDEFNRVFNCTGLDEETLDCFISLIHTIVVTPVFAVSFTGGSEPDVEDLRGGTKGPQMNDTRPETRAKPVLPIGSNRRKIAMFIAPDTPDEPARSTSSAATLAHELGHALLGLPDLYQTGVYRAQVQYVLGHCLMGDSGSFAHFCAYNKRVKGWLADDAILLIDRPDEDVPINREVVLIQLEHWDSELDEEARVALAQSLLSGMQPDTPVDAAVFLRLGGDDEKSEQEEKVKKDGRQFNILELRGKGERFSQGIDPPRVLITNAIDPNDDTRYADDEVEDAGTTSGVLEKYRRKVHKLSSGLRAVGDVFDFATDPEFPEVGLTVEVLELATGSTGSASFTIARLAVHWKRGPAIDLGFTESTPDWTSPDIAIFKPEEIAADGTFEFPENQGPETLETFRVPADADEGPFNHKVGVRVWNFGDAPALKVQVQLVLRMPAGAGDWKDTVIDSEVVDEIAPTDSSDPPILGFDWAVGSEIDTHVCFRAQIGDRDVPRNDQGVALASDDTNAQNDWAQQNVFIFEAPADSPPEPVEFTFQVMNDGSYLEEVRLEPRGLGLGARMTVMPARLRIAPKSRGLFRVRVELDEALLDARCGKDISFLLEAWRVDDHAETRWGAAKYVIKPRKRTETLLEASMVPEQLHLWGHVTPDVGAQRILLYIQRPAQPSLWEEVPLGPGSSFDFELQGSFPFEQEVRATAHFDGTNEFSSSVSETIRLIMHIAG